MINYLVYLGGGNPGFITIGPTNSGADYECNGTNDTTQFQTAINEGKPIILYPGEYTLTNKIEYENAITIIGIPDPTFSGLGSANYGPIINTHYNSDLFYIGRGPVYFANLRFRAKLGGFTGLVVLHTVASTDPSLNVKIDNCNFDYSYTGVDLPTGVIYAEGIEYDGDGCSITNCSFNNCNNPIYASGIYVDIINNKFYDCAGMAINATSYSGSSSQEAICNIKDNIIYRVGEDDTNSAIGVYNFNIAQINNNEIVNYKGGSTKGIMDIHTISKLNVNNNIVYNYISTSANIKIFTITSSNKSTNYIFSNNIVYITNSTLQYFIYESSLSTMAGMVSPLIIGNSCSGGMTNSKINYSNSVIIGNSWQTETLY